MKIYVEYDDDLDELKMKVLSTSNVQIKNELIFPKDLVISTLSEGVMTWSMKHNENLHSAFLSRIKQLMG